MTELPTPETKELAQMKQINGGTEESTGLGAAEAGGL